MTEDQFSLIATDPAVAHGQPTITGTRVLVSVVLDCLAAGMTTEKILGEYPSLTEEGIRAVAAYGAALARDEMVPLPASCGPRAHAAGPFEPGSGAHTPHKAWQLGTVRLR